MAKLTINIDGYGEITIKKPKEYNEETFSDAAGEVAAKVMNLVSPRKQRKRFHPVLGLGGYADHDHRGPSRRVADTGTE